MSSAGRRPVVSTALQSGFHAFLRPYLRRHFDCIGVHRDSSLFPESDLNAAGFTGAGPLLLYTNHPAWWDPLIAHFLNRQLFAPRQFYAPIDAAALQQYRVFGKLGFFGVELGTTSGAAEFLRTSMAILESPHTALWITPEGRFADPRDHAAPLMPGLAHLCTKLTAGAVIPLALEYVFWQERLPLCLVKFGEPLEPAAAPGWEKSQWQAALTERLRQTQRQLATSVIARDAAAIRPLLLGRSGAGGMYDTMRRLRSWLGGKRFRSRHGEHFR